MKFRFVGEGDCPPWVLGALHATGALPAPLYTKLLGLLVQEDNEDALRECLKDTSLASRGETARAAAALRWVLRQARSSRCPAGAFLRDLLVLGVPRSHALAFAETLENVRDERERELAETGFMVNKLTDVEMGPAPEGTVLTMKVTLYTEDTITGRKGKKEVLLDKAHIRNMLRELKQAKAKLEDCEIQFDQKRRRGMQID